MLLTLNQFREYFLTSPHSVADRWLVTHFCMTYSLSFFNSVILRLLPRMSYSNLYRIIIYFAVCNFQGTNQDLSRLQSGDKGIRTLDPLLARQVLSQLSYTPRSMASTYVPTPLPA